MPYRPPSWNQAPSLTTVMLLFPGQQSTAQYSSAQGISVSLPTQATRYIFDAVIRSGHNQELVLTEHPVQTGGAISDHAYVLPARLVLDIGMSDAMDSYEKNIWVGGPTKSTSAYQILLAMQFARIPLSVVTKYRLYANMQIRAIDADDTAQTVSGLRARIMFQEVFIADTQSTPDSARKQDTQTNSFGVKSPANPSQAQVSNNQVPATVAPVNVPGAGTPGTPNCWDSNNTITLQPSH